MTKVIKEEFEKLGLLEINEDLFTYDKRLGMIFNEFNRLGGIHDDLFTYEIENPTPCTPSIPFPHRLRKEKEEAQQRKFLENLKQLHINLSFIEALAQMPKDTKFLKSLQTNKARLEEACTVWKKSIIQADLETCDSIGDESGNNFNLGTPIRRIDLVNTPYSVAQETARSDEVESEHLYSASANEIDEKKPELKDLPHHLEYAYLHSDKSFPIIISSNLSKKEKMLLL
ncbi:hypothetical protein Tco_0233741 [Tanacetum coccineum]